MLTRGAVAKAEGGEEEEEEGDLGELDEAIVGLQVRMACGARKKREGAGAGAWGPGASLMRLMDSSHTPPPPRPLSSRSSRRTSLPGPSSSWDSGAHPPG